MIPKASFTGPDICAQPARKVVELLKKGDISPSELIDASLTRIKQVSPAVNATVTLCEDRARNSLQDLPELAENHSQEPGWLAGLPIGIKDLNLVSGVKTTYGNVGLKDFIPQESDHLVSLLEQRGGVVLGKTNTPEFGAGGNTFNEVFGQTRNPWDTRKNAGGSSGGAAVSLATGEFWLSHGSDLGGSLRTPASYCGIVGLRPSPGRCGGGPALTAFSTEGVSGPMARDVEDLALFLDAMCGYDPKSPLTIEAPATSFQKALEQSTNKIRIGFSEDQGGFAPVEKYMRQLLRSAMDKMSDAGSIVEDACPALPGLHDTFMTLRGIHFGSLNAYLPQEIQKHFKKTLAENTEFGVKLESSKIYDAIRQRTVIYNSCQQFFERYDVLAIPVTGIEPGLAEEEYPTVVDNQPMQGYMDWLRFSFLATTATLPAISVPVAFTESGMPVGIQLVGPPRGEAKLLQAALAIERTLQLPSSPIDPILR